MKIQFKKLTNLSLFIALIAGTVNAAEEVNIYSGRKEALIKPALDQFTEKTGIKVNLVTGKADALMQRLLVEGSASPADILIASDVGRLSRAKSKGLFQTINSDELLKQVPENFRDVDAHWFGLSLRARPIFYAKDRVDASELISYEGLVKQNWQGRICIRSSSNIYNQSLVASFLNANGEAATQTWLKGFVDNFARKPTGGDTDQLRAIAAGVCDIAIANTYYYGRLLNSSKEEDQDVAKKIAIFWPNQADRGVHVNVSGAGLVKSAKNVSNAVKLIEFLASSDIQQWYAEVNNEYPVVKNVQPSATLAAWGSFKSDDVALTELGVLNAKAVMMMDVATWR